ncbi:MAG: hypothetical protein SF069_04310 [Phycisphaerae bacterium]|nr:hypothetical protein [Phycisphaerae bacterium]
MSKTSAHNEPPLSIRADRVGFALLVALGAFALTLALWPFVRGAFADGLLLLLRGSVTVNTAAGRLLIDSPVSAAAKGIALSREIDAVVSHRTDGPISPLGVESFANLYVPLSGWICLALATPRSSLRRASLLLLGLIPLLALCWLRLEALLLHELLTPGGAPASAPTMTASWAGWVVQAFVNPPAMQFAPAIVVWLLFGFRPADWRGARSIG